MSDSANKRIAHNTVLLYIRMIVVLAISLYTSRLVLAILGVEDYGLYNVVGSIVTMFMFLRSAMGNATNRYIAFSLGKDDEQEQNRVFSTCINVHLILAIIIIVLCEVVGLWLFYNKLVIPSERVSAAFWVFQFSILTCALGIICVPYDAVIIAHEKMGAFAFMSLFDVIMKLAAVLVLKYLTYDKLISYAFFLLLIQFINRIIYSVYCRHTFIEAHYKAYWDGNKVREIFSFAGWNIIGNMASIGCTPVLNILLNMFFGPVVNAARGIAVQVQSAANSFVSNFQLAITPQITKSYAIGDIKRVRLLVTSGSKLTFFLFLCIAVPVSFEAESLLSIWLVEVPEHTVTFLRIVLAVLMLESWQQILHVTNLATGQIRKFQIIKGLSLMSMIPISYLVLALGAKAEIVFIVQFIVTFISLLIQLLLIRPLIELSLSVYVKEVFMRPMLVLLFSIPLPLLLHILIPTSGIFPLLVVCVIDVISALIISYLVGMNESERSMVKAFITPLVSKLTR